MELHRISRKDLRRFGIVLGIALAVIGTIHLLKGNINIYPWFYIIGASGLILGIFIPIALKPVYFALTRIARTIGGLITGLVLVVVFYAVLTPIGLIARLFGKDFLNINWKKKSDTYWIKKEPSSEGIERYERQF